MQWLFWRKFFAYLLLLIVPHALLFPHVNVYVQIFCWAQIGSDTLHSTYTTHTHTHSRSDHGYVYSINYWMKCKFNLQFELNYSKKKKHKRSHDECVLHSFKLYNFLFTQWYWQCIGEFPLLIYSKINID